MFWSLRTDRRGLPEFFLILFHFQRSFYVALCKSFCISHDPAVVNVKLVLKNFAIFTENT